MWFYLCICTLYKTCFGASEIREEGGICEIVNMPFHINILTIKNLKSEIRSKLMKKYGAKFVRVSIWFVVFLTTVAYFCVSCYSVVACK